MGAVLARIADLHVRLAHAHLELSEFLQNELDVRGERALMWDVEKPDNPARLMSVRDVAERLSLSERTVRRLRRRGVLPSGIEVAGTIRWTPESIESWIGGRA